ncbi:MAG: hypothetical protein ACRERU_18875 [Methylococcales bacterium]
MKINELDPLAPYMPTQPLSVEEIELLKQHPSLFSKFSSILSVSGDPPRLVVSGPVDVDSLDIHRLIIESIRMLNKKSTAWPFRWQVWVSDLVGPN